jgi:BirA family biotin operon repressor/biotin-[acetyl-CoA-carboxylase] ligase
VGAAARAAVDQLCRDVVLAKWPNDLVSIDGPAPGKLGGVLAEFVEGDTPCVVVGIGVNIRPIEGQPGASSVVECGGTDDRDRVLAALLSELAPRLGDESGVIDDLRSHSATIGSRVRVELPDGAELRGEAVDLTTDGELVVRTDDEALHIVATGDVIHLRRD